MRGLPDPQLAMLTTLQPGDVIPADHPIRRIRKVVDAVLVELDDEFTAMYARSGRPSVPPEQLLKATILMAMYSIRSERAFCERLNYDLLFKWFLDLPIDAKALLERSVTTMPEEDARTLLAPARDCLAGTDTDVAKPNDGRTVRSPQGPAGGGRGSAAR